MAHFLLVLCIFLVARTAHAFNQHYCSSFSTIVEKKTTKVQEETSSLHSSNFKTNDASSPLVAPRNNTSNNKMSRNSDPTTASEHYVKALWGVLLVLLGDPLLVAAKSTSTYSMEYNYMQNFALANAEGLPMIVSVVGVISVLLDSVKGEVKTEINSVKSGMDSVKSEVKAEISSVKSEVKAEISSVKAEMSSVKSEMKAEISSVKADMRLQL
jgi:hypothetical protein